MAGNHETPEVALRQTQASHLGLYPVFRAGTEQIIDLNDESSLVYAIFLAMVKTGR
jgi:hypothetical protein